MTHAAQVNARGRQQGAAEAAARQRMPRRDGRKAASYNYERMEDEAAVFAVDASGSNGDLVGRATRLSKRPAPPPPTAREWGKARGEYGIFEHQRNPGRPAMLSAGIVQKAGVREADLRAEGVEQRAREHEQRGARRTRPRTQ